MDEGRKEWRKDRCWIDLTRTDDWMDGQVKDTATDTDEVGSVGSVRNGQVEAVCPLVRCTRVQCHSSYSCLRSIT